MCKQIELAQSWFVLSQLLATIASFLMVAAGFFYAKDLAIDIWRINIKYSEIMFYTGASLGLSSLIFWFIGRYELQFKKNLSDMEFTLLVFVLSFSFIILIFILINCILPRI